jgi:hypothetical protein
MSIFGKTLASVAALIAALIAALNVAGASYAQSGGYPSQLTGLHDALHLTNAQEGGWRAYVAAISPDPASEARRSEMARMIPSLPTPRRVDLINAEVDADAAMVHRQGAAVKAFYASLTPDQQRTFDRQTATQAGGAQAGGQRGQGGPPLNRPSNSNLPPPQ